VRRLAESASWHAATRRTTPSDWPTSSGVLSGSTDGLAGVAGASAGLDFQVSESVVTGRGPTEAVVQTGILAQGVAHTTVVGSTVVDNNHTRDALAAGIALNGASDVLVAWSTVEANSCGIGAHDAGDIVARQNNVRSNALGALDRGSAIVDATNNWWGAADGPSTATGTSEYRATRSMDVHARGGQWRPRA